MGVGATFAAHWCSASGYCRWAERTLAVTRGHDPQPVELQISARALIGWISMCQGVHDEVERMLDECVAARVPDPQARANWRTDPERDLGLPEPVEFTLGSELMLVRRDARAVAVLARREKSAARGDLGGAAMSELFEALAVGRTALAHQLSMGDQWGTVWAVHIRTWTLARMVADGRTADGVQPDPVQRWALEIAQLMGGAATLRHQLAVAPVGVITGVGCANCLP